MNWSISRFGTVSSTNDIALERIRTGPAVQGEVLVACHQSAGRGRRGRSWADDEGALLFTAVLQAPDTNRHWCGLTAAMAVAIGLRRLGCDAGVKWPNDVVCAGRKLAGVLIEIASAPTPAIHPDLAAVGMGVNVNNPASALSPPAISLKEVTGTEVELDAALREILGALESLWLTLCSGGVDALMAAWRELDTTPGSLVRWRSDGSEGVVVGLETTGALRVRPGRGPDRLADLDDVDFIGTVGNARGAA